MVGRQLARFGVTYAFLLSSVLVGCGTRSPASHEERTQSTSATSELVLADVTPEGDTESPAATSGNLIPDPGFESGFSGFFLQDRRDSLSRTTVSPIVGRFSLMTTLRNWGSNLWWDTNVGGTPFQHASSMQVSAKVKGVATDTRSNFDICADATYSDATLAEQCTVASKTVGLITTVTANLTLNPAKTLSQLSFRITLDGPRPVTYMIDDVSLSVTTPSPTPSPTPTPTPTPRPTPTPTPTPTPIPTPTPTPTPVPTPSPTPVPTPTPTPSPTPTPTPTPSGYIATPTNLTAAWANEGADKVTRDEHRGTTSPSGVTNSSWTGSKIQIWGGRNEVVNFNLILEAATVNAPNVKVTFDTLTGPNGALIRSVGQSGDGVFNWTQRNIELFYLRYLQIQGLSLVSYDNYDERHIPKRLERPWTGDGMGTGTWSNRPDHDKFYPDIAVPLELVPTFAVAAGQNQSIWADVYIPKTAPAGIYQGFVLVTETGKLSYQIPVELVVRGFDLPDVPNSKTMAYLGYPDLGLRYTGLQFPNAGSSQDTLLKLVRDRHFQLAHRHKISLIDQDPGSTVWNTDAPRPEWSSRLNGNLFTSAQGYDGPGVGQSNNVYSIGTYGTWSWMGGTRADMWTHSDAWQNWFNVNAPTTEHFLYLIDESSNYPQTEQWAQWIASNPGSGKNLMSFATIPLPTAVSSTPSLNIVASTFRAGDTATWQNAYNTFRSAPNKRFYLYNAERPFNGSFATEDDGVSLRELAWAQYKKGVDRWFFWESTYYNDYQSGRGQTNVFQTAQTFGAHSGFDAVLGQTGWNYANGDGLLFYPGTDQVYPSDSYGLNGPIASLRLKFWRRGIQDVDYLTLASQVNPAATRQILVTMVPKAFWEYGVTDPSDPTYVRTDISWSIRPDDWEAARQHLANIIETGNP
jgi:hypothetical protein